MDDNREMTKLEIDAWERRRQRLKQYYIAKGMTEDDADDAASADVGRQIRES